MPFGPDTQTASQHKGRTTGNNIQPNNSAPNTAEAIGVLVAPANTATSPNAASQSVGKGRKADKLLPKVAPVKKRGVTSPPLKPAPRVKVVYRVLARKSYQG